MLCKNCLTAAAETRIPEFEKAKNDVTREHAEATQSLDHAATKHVLADSAAEKAAAAFEASKIGAVHSFVGMLRLYR
jgi:hypothetical protein